jgi:uncharacterized protein
MLTHEDICAAVKNAAKEYRLVKVSYFGSYAKGSATEKSDLDLLVEFDEPGVSLWTISALQLSLQDLLKIPVDVLHVPLPKKSRLEIGETVVAYDGR